MKRERYIDIAKGFSILCIVMLHYENGLFPHPVNQFIGSFMITLFYVTAGWIQAMQTKERTFGSLLRKRWKQLGIPYLWWSVIILAWDLILVLLGFYDMRFVGQETYKAVILRGIGTLWFLPALFGGEIVWFWLARQKRRVWLLVLLLTLLYQSIYHDFFDNHTETVYRIIDAPFRVISNILNAWIGIAFGYLSYKKLKGFVNDSGYVFLAGLAFCLAAYATANYLPAYLSFLWPLFAPLLGPLGVLFIARSIQESRCMSFFDYWGTHSLNVMVTHYSITMVAFQIIVEYVFNLGFKGWITMLCFLLSLPLQWGMVKIVDRYAKCTVGKS